MREFPSALSSFPVALLLGLLFPAALAGLYLNRDLSDAMRFLCSSERCPNVGGLVGVGMTDDDDDDDDDDGGGVFSFVF